MLKKASFRNFSCIPNGDWQFAAGVNVIVGENGLGKSHVLKAIYSLVKVQADSKTLTKSELGKNYATKLVSVFRPEKLGRLAKRKQGREHCEIELFFDESEYDASIAFATNAKNQVEVIRLPKQALRTSPIFLPTRELVTLCPWFLPIYETYHLEFEETWRDTVLMLSNPTLKELNRKTVNELIKPLERDMGGKVVLDPKTGRLYLRIPGEGQMEMPLLAEGLRKLAMLARLASTGVLLQNGYLFWDEPETNLNPKLIRTIAKTILRIAKYGVQVFVATQSVFLLRELDLLLREADFADVPQRWFALTAMEQGVELQQDASVDGIDTIVALDEELLQSGRFLELSKES